MSTKITMRHKEVADEAAEVRERNATTAHDP